MQPADPLSLLPLAAAALRQLAAFLLLAAAAAGAGRLLTRRLPSASRLEALAVAIVVGLGALGTALFLVGLAGGLRRGVVLALAAAAAGAGAAALAAGRRPGTAARAAALPSSFEPAPRAAALALALALLPAFVWSLFPPTGFDAIAYHLPFARAFVESHRLVAVPELLFPVFPQIAEVLFAGMMLATGADVAAHLVQLLAVAAVALLLVAGGRRFFSPRAGLWAAALWLAHPLVHYQAASAYVDSVLAMFCLLAVYAWEVWREERQRGERQPGARGAGGGWLAVAGAAAGFAAATKYLGLLWLGCLVLVALAAGPRRRVVPAALLAVALVLAGPWYARIHHHTGSPVHPFLGSLFSGQDSSLQDGVIGLDDADTPADAVGSLARGVGRALTRPWKVAVFAWQASFEPAAFNRQSPLAPWHLALAPLAAVFAGRDRRLLRWLLLVAGYALLWSTHDPRYQLPSAALLALAGAGALHHLGERLPVVGRRLARPLVAWALAAGLALPGPAYALYKIRRHGPLPPATPAARHAFLARELPGYAAVRRLNEGHGDGFTVFAVDGVHLTYFARGRLLGHALGPWRAELVTPHLGDPAALHRALRALGADHLLVVGHQRAALGREAPFDRLFLRLAGDESSELFALRPEGAAATAEGVE